MPRLPNHAVAAAERLNLAVGLFDDMGRVASAMDALQTRRLPPTRCRFVVASNSPAFAADGSLRLPRGLAVERIVVQGLDPDHAWTEIVLAGLLAGHSEGGRDQVHDDAFTPPALTRQKQQLMQHLEAGGGALVVGLDDQSEQQAVAGVLLRLASLVFTHQVRALRPGSDPQGTRTSLPAAPFPQPV